MQWLNSVFIKAEINEALLTKLNHTPQDLFNFHSPALFLQTLNTQWQPALETLQTVDSLLLALAYFALSTLLFYCLSLRANLPGQRSISWVFAWLMGVFGIIQLIHTGVIRLATDSLGEMIQLLSAGIAIYTVFTLIVILRRPPASDQKTQSPPKQFKKLDKQQPQTDSNSLAKIAPETPDSAELNYFFQVCVDMFCVADVDGYFKWVNPAVQSILGYTEAEFMAQPWLNLVHPEDQAATVRMASKHMEQNQPIFSFQNRYRCKDGSSKWLSWSAMPVPAQQKMYCIARDLTSKQEASTGIQHLNETPAQGVQEPNEQLKTSNQQLLNQIGRYERTENILRKMMQLQQAILNGANYTIIATNATGTIQLFNQTAERVLGYSAQEMVGQATPEVFHDFDEICQKAVVLSQELGVEIEPGFEVLVAKARTGSADENEWTYIRKDGSRFSVELSVTALFDAGGAVSGFLGIGSDITRRKAAEQQLRELTEELKRSNQELEQFAYIASHDLQEPLRAVHSYAQLLCKRYQGQFDQKADQWFENLISGANRMQQLINDLLAYSRVGTQGALFAPADCNVILCKALANLQVTIAEKQVVIDSDLLPVVVADAGQLVQLFQNLIGNGIKFCGDQTPQIYIGVQKSETQWLFSVKDHGIGIEDEYTERIFEIFQRLHSRRVYAGTGIGLAICKRIVERHGGQIWVESQLNQGSTFYFTISTLLKVK